MLSGEAILRRSWVFPLNIFYEMCNDTTDLELNGMASDKQVIADHLVTFEDIREMQERNRMLVQVIPKEWRTPRRITSMQG